MSKYYKANYIKEARFVNYWNQINEVLKLKPTTVLEIGIGNKIVSSILEKFNTVVTTMDIEKELKPDIVGSVTQIPLPDSSHDLVLAAEILEHLPFKEFIPSLKEIYRVSKSSAIISVPYKGFIFALFFKIPFIKWFRLMVKLPYFWQTKPENSEHYWEIGLKNYSLKKIRSSIIKSNFKIKKEFYSKNDPDRYFFVLVK